ncbi:Small ubiquitin-related modifier 1 [Vanrija albida]|uniref:Small ubiquitin-related modifier 1 n=1 Tax=Vanrija albida TaxID=181172 RepID=A0ABR3Q415_9TREE
MPVTAPHAMPTTRAPSLSPAHWVHKVSQPSQPNPHLKPELKPASTPAADSSLSVLDIKPKIDGLVPEGIDFKPLPNVVRQPHRARVPNVNSIRISLQGSRDGVPYLTWLRVYPDTSVERIKDYLNTEYGYDASKLRLLYDGKILKDTDRTQSLELEEGDNIDVYLERPHPKAAYSEQHQKREAHVTKSLPAVTFVLTRVPIRK